MDRKQPQRAQRSCCKKNSRTMTESAASPIRRSRNTANSEARNQGDESIASAA